MQEELSLAAWGYMVCLLGGLFIELFFRLISYRDGLNRVGGALRYQPVNYMTVTEYISSGESKWLRYVCFRTLPPLIVFILLAAVLEAYFPQTNTLIGLLLAAVASIVFRDGKSLLNRKITIAEKLIHLTNIFLVFTSAVVVWSMTLFLPLNVLAPSLNGIVDNLWSSLFIATLVVLYLDTTNIRGGHRSDTEGVAARTNYVLREYASIQKRYQAEIKESVSQYNTSEPLLYAVLIYESMNRPKFLRIFENLFVRLLGLELTVGIAQVKSSRPLTDQESIHKAAAILKNTNLPLLKEASAEEEILVTKAVKRYNSDPRYLDNIEQILGLLYMYEPTIFEV